MENCIFCRISAGAQPSEKIFEDNNVFAFLDINPVNKGHVLIVPKKHFRNIYDAEDKFIDALFETAKIMATALKDGVKAEGVNIIMNNELAAGQILYHAHVHIIPRFKNDGFEAWRGASGYDTNEIERTGELIRQHLKK